MTLSASETTFIQTHGHSVVLAMHPYLVQPDADLAANKAVNQVAPVVTGNGAVGQVLSSTTGTWLNSPTFTYAWQRNGVVIAGATAATYTLVSADSGKSVRSVVTGTSAGGANSAPSNAIAVA